MQKMFPKSSETMIKILAIQIEPTISPSDSHHEIGIWSNRDERELCNAGSRTMIFDKLRSGNNTKGTYESTETSVWIKTEFAELLNGVYCNYGDKKPLSNYKHST